MPQEEMDKRLLEACKNNDHEEFHTYIKMGASVQHDKDGWNPLLWAACNGNEEFVRELIKRNAHSAYATISSENDGQEKNLDDDGNDDPFIKPPDPQKTGKYTPLHWASHKGHYKVVWILLQNKLNPLEIDMHGNTSIH